MSIRRRRWSARRSPCARCRPTARTPVAPTRPARPSDGPCRRTPRPAGPRGRSPWTSLFP
ncbi:MAG: hypothetical protein DMD87_04830 [Candidatus Rokuibacteriota bacterium]|nr:MAG: hypothetical protein DMD87_04830 [Candidatus Rokubacteria bacterium]